MRAGHIVSAISKTDTIIVMVTLYLIAADNAVQQQQQQLFRGDEKFQHSYCDSATAYSNTDTSADIHLVCSMYLIFF